MTTPSPFDLPDPGGWAWRNRQMRAPEAVVGELANRLVDRLALGTSEKRDKIGFALGSALPAFLAARISAWTLRGGRLTVWVSCPASRYELQTRWADALKDAVCRAEPAAKLRSVQFRLRTGGAG